MGLMNLLRSLGWARIAWASSIVIGFSDLIHLCQWFEMPDKEAFLEGLESGIFSGIQQRNSFYGRLPLSLKSKSLEPIKPTYTRRYSVIQAHEYCCRPTCRFAFEQTMMSIRQFLAWKIWICSKQQRVPLKHVFGRKGLELSGGRNWKEANIEMHLGANHPMDLFAKFKWHSPDNK